MANHERAPKRVPCLTPTDLKLLGSPLMFLQEDHLREREICSEIDVLAQARTPDRKIADRILTFLKNELPLHLADEEEDLFPLLKRRCEVDDEIDKAIRRLESDHKHADEDTPSVIAVLQKITSGGRVISDKERRMLTLYASHARRHLILENAIILPFAKLRLTDGDLESLRLRMMQRRGLDNLVDTRDAE